VVRELFCGAPSRSVFWARPRALAAVPLPSPRPPLPPLSPSHRRSSPRRGAVKPLVAVCVVALALLVALAWFLLGGDAAPAAGDAASASQSESAARVDAPTLEGERDAEGRESAQRPIYSNEGFVVQPGVRLSGPGRLTGRVLDRSSGAPVAGTGVELLPVPPVAREFFGRVLRLANASEGYVSRVDPVAVAVSEADGSFSFEGVYSGTYYIQARGARHVPDSVARAYVAESGAGGPVELFVRGGGRVLGVVLLPGGRPAARVQVALTLGPGLAIESARSGDACYLESRTDDDGSFVIAGVPPGAGYDVTAAGAGFALSHALDLEVREGEDTTVVLQTRSGGSVEGRVLARPKDGDEKATPRPVAGAHVAVVPRGLRSLQFAEEVLEATHAVTGADGRFRIDSAPAGELDLVGVAEGCLPAKGPRVMCADGSLALAGDFELPRGPMVNGRVVDSAGKPVEGAVVRWNPIDFRNFEFDFSFAPLLAASVKGFDYPRTDADGRFTAGAFAGKGPHRIDFFKLGYANQRFEWNPAEQKDDIEVVMRAGGAVEGIVMDLERKAPVTSFTIQTRDRVETQIDAPGNNNPFSGGIVFEARDGRFRLDPVKGGEKISFTVSARGYLDKTVEDLTTPEGETLRGVIVELELGARITGTVTNLEGEPVAGAQVFAVPAERAESFERRNRGQRRGAPELEQIPPGFRDFAAQLGLLGDRAVPSKADGTFELIGLEPGPTVVLASHRDYVIGRSNTVIAANEGEPAEVEIELSTGGGVFGRALDRFGRPVSGAIVIAASPANMAGEGRANGGALYQGRTDAEGQYRIDRMAAGGYFLLLTRGDEALNPTSFLGTLNFDLVTVPGDERVEYDILDTSSGATRVFGRVLDGADPVSRGAITALSFESESMLGLDLKIAQIGADGAYEFSGLAPGEYQFNIDGQNRRGGVRVSAEIPDAPEFRLDLRYPEGGLEGRVVDARDGSPIADARVTARRVQTQESGGWLGRMVAQESGVARETSAEDGSFKFTRLDAGAFQLTVSPPRGGEQDEARRYAASAPLTIEVRTDQVERGIELRLPPALALAGRVLDEGGAAVAEAQLIATRVDLEGAAPERATSGEDGAYRFDSLAEGKYDLSASAEGFADTLLRDVAVSAERSTPVDVIVRNGVAVSVKVTSAGRPVSGATGRLVPQGRESEVAGADVGRALTNLFAGKGVSNSAGILDLGVHAPGEYRLEVQRGLERVAESVKIEATDKVELRVRLK
jgi:5-hydroxyisourate hydrolase-like protein (transthyretin family)